MATDTQLHPLDVTNCTRGDIIKLLFSEAELRNVDPSIPFDSKVDQAFWWVMDYNTDTVFGRLVDLRERAKEQGRELITRNGA